MPGRGHSRSDGFVSCLRVASQCAFDYCARAEYRSRRSHETSRHEFVVFRRAGRYQAPRNWLCMSALCCIAATVSTAGAAAMQPYKKQCGKKKHKASELHRYPPRMGIAPVQCTARVIIIWRPPHASVRRRSALRRIIRSELAQGQPSADDCGRATSERGASLRCRGSDTQGPPPRSMCWDGAGQHSRLVLVKRTKWALR